MSENQYILVVSQPHYCEQYSLQPVPKAMRQGGAWPLFNIFCNLFINPGTLITSGMMITAGLSFQSTVLLQVTAVMVGMIPFLVFSQAGVQYGIPGQVFCRAIFGIRGARWVTSVLRLLCSVYWFAFQTAAGALAIEAIFRNCFQIILPLWSVSLVFAVFQGVIAIIGYHYLKWLSMLAFPAKLLIFLLLILFLIGYGGEAASPSVVLNWPGMHWYWPLIAAWLNTIICTCFTCVTDASDFSRYTRSKNSLWLGVLSGAFVGTLIGAFFGAYGVIAGGAVSINPFETITALQPGVWVVALVALVIFLDNWTINVINLYTGGLSLCNALENLGRFRATAIVTVLAAFLSCFPAIIHDYTDIMGTIGGMFAPITGVMLVWYFKKFNTVDLPSLYRQEGKYWYTGGFNVKACMLIPTAFLISLTISPLYLPGVVTLLISSLGYLVCVTMAERKSQAGYSRTLPGSR